MTAALDALFAGPFGPALAILLVGSVSYACRAGGVVLMARVRPTPRVERALRALPGSIIVATAVPSGLAAGAPGLAGLAVAALVMAALRVEVVALAAGVAAVAAGRALGY